MNKIKDYITDIIGLSLWALTIYLLYCGSIKWWPDSVIGFAVGAVMFYVEDQWVTKHLKEWIKKKFGK